MPVNALEIAVLFIFIYAFVEWFSSECDGELKAIARNHITWQCCLRIWTESIYKPRWPLKTSFNVVKKKIILTGSGENSYFFAYILFLFPKDRAWGFATFSITTTNYMHILEVIHLDFEKALWQNFLKEQFLLVMLKQ